MVSKSRLEVLQAHLYILNNTYDVIPYIDAYKVIVKENNPRQPKKWVLMEHNETFNYKSSIIIISCFKYLLTIFMDDVGITDNYLCYP